MLLSPFPEIVGNKIFHYDAKKYNKQNVAILQRFL